MALTFIINLVTFSPVQDAVDNQRILQIPSEVAPDLIGGKRPKGPKFSPPGGIADDFKCEYPQMVGWEMCSTPSDRKCWLRRTSDNAQYDVFTNYENEMPIGVTRYYELELVDGSWDADGMDFVFAKLFNNTYPGPWIQACWGDTYVPSLWLTAKRN